MKIHVHYSSSMGTRLSLILNLVNQNLMCPNLAMVMYTMTRSIRQFKSCIELLFCPLHTRTHKHAHNCVAF